MNTQLRVAVRLRYLLHKMRILKNTALKIDGPMHESRCGEYSRKMIKTSQGHAKRSHSVSRWSWVLSAASFNSWTLNVIVECETEKTLSTIMGDSFLQELCSMLDTYTGRDKVIDWLNHCLKVQSSSEPLQKNISPMTTSFMIKKFSTLWSRKNSGSKHFHFHLAFVEH